MPNPNTSAKRPAILIGITMGLIPATLILGDHTK